MPTTAENLKDKKLLRHCMSQAKKFALRFGRIGSSDPDDLVQMAMIKLLKRRDADGPPTLSWIYSTVRSAAYDAMRPPV